MKGDKLDIKLREKLGQMSVEPPAHMWERIEMGLAAAPLQPVADVRKSDARPLRRRIISWTAAAAACLLAGVISYSLFNNPQPEALLAGDTLPKAVTEQPILADPTLPSDGAEKTTNDTSSPERPEVKKNASSPAIRDKEPILVAKEETPYNIEPPIVDKTPQDDRSVEGEESSGNKNIQDKTSDMKTRERSAVKENPLRSVAEDAPYRARRRTPISTSLFAANFGGIQLEGDVMGSTRVANETPEQAGKLVKYNHKMPLAFGLNVSYGLTDYLSVETGMVYTYLHSESETVKDSRDEFEQKLHYLGIPVMVRYDIWNTRLVKIYAGVGGTIEKCIDAKEIDKWSYRNWETTSLDAKGFMFSVNAAAGIQLKIDKTFGLYLEPSLNYFFDAPKQPESYRTQNPLSFSIKAGFRINLR